MRPLKLPNIWKSTRARIIVAAAFIGGSATFLANANTIIAFIEKTFSRKGLVLVSASFPSSDSLDIKLRNTGAEVSLLKKVEISIKGRWLLVPGDESKTFLAPSSNYDILIDTAVRPGGMIAKEISEEIGPNKTSRFLLRFGPLQKDLLCSYVYLADLSIFYDEDNKKLTQENILFALVDHSGIYSEYADSYRRSINLAIVDDINRHEGIRSAGLTNLIKLIKER